MVLKHNVRLGATGKTAGKDIESFLPGITDPVGLRAGAGAGAIPNCTEVGKVAFVIFVMTPLQQSNLVLREYPS